MPEALFRIANELKRACKENESENMQEPLFTHNSVLALVIAEKNAELKAERKMCDSLRSERDRLKALLSESAPLIAALVDRVDTDIDANRDRICCGGISLEQYEIDALVAARDAGNALVDKINWVLF